MLYIYYCGFALIVINLICISTRFRVFIVLFVIFRSFTFVFFKSHIRFAICVGSLFSVTFESTISLTFCLIYYFFGSICLFLSFGTTCVKFIATRCLRRDITAKCSFVTFLYIQNFFTLPKVVFHLAILTLINFMVMDRFIEIPLHYQKSIFLIFKIYFGFTHVS